MKIPTKAELFELNNQITAEKYKRDIENVINELRNTAMSGLNEIYISKYSSPMPGTVTIDHRSIAPILDQLKNLDYSVTQESDNIYTYYKISWENK